MSDYGTSKGLNAVLIARVTPEDREELELLAQKIDRPLSYIVRLGLRSVLAEHRKQRT